MSTRMDVFDLDAVETPSSLHNNRRAPRVTKRIEITLQAPEREQKYVTHDISYVGVFVECPDPLPLRKLMRVQAHIDPEQEPIKMLGLVAHRVNAVDAMESGRSPGMGIQLFALGHDMRSTWRHFVRQEYEKNPDAREAVRRQEYPRLKVHFPNTDEMRKFATEHVASGNVFIRSADLYQQGTRIWLEAVHPGSGLITAVEAIVLEFIESPRQNRGMRLMFSDGEAARDTLLASIT